MELFDFVKVLFADGKKYDQLKNSEKARHFFMINRFFSIKYPSTAQQLNRVGINSWAVVDLWKIVGSRFGKVPGWIYTKTKKTKSDKEWKPDPEVSKIWMQRNNVGERELKDAIRFYPEEMKKLFSSIEKQIKVYD